MSSGKGQRAKARLVISDLHIGEGRRNWDGSVNVLEDFTVDKKFAEFIDYYLHSYDQVELVLAGNFLEMTQCRVLSDFPDMMFETYAAEIVGVVRDGHPQVFEALRRFMEKPSNRLIYLVGDSDLGILWPRVQQILKDLISPRVEFKANFYFEDGIYIQHGHQYEAMYGMDYENPTREQNGLPVLKLPWASFFYSHFVLPLRKIRPQFYRVRPFRQYLIWALLFETRFLARIISQFFRMLSQASRQRLYPGSSFLDIFKIFGQSADSEALENYAEVLLSSDTTQKVIFGQAHVPNYRQFRNGKEYFNTGSWTRNLSLDMRSLGSSHKLTYVLIEFRAESEPQAKLMEWHGRHDAIEDYV